MNKQITVNDIEATVFEVEASEILGYWFTEQVKSRGWYTCLVTGTKKRGKEVIDLIEKQAELAKELEEQAQAEIIEEEPTKEVKSKSRKKKAKSLEEVQAKYLHVHRIITFEIPEDQVGEGVDTVSTLNSATDTSNFTEKLFDWTEDEILSGRTSYVFYEIKCVDCGKLRVIKPQDAFQVKRCEACTLKHRKANRRK